jgi:hypothetical protein
MAAEARQKSRRIASLEATRIFGDFLARHGLYHMRAESQSATFFFVSFFYRSNTRTAVRVLKNPI